MARAAQEGLTAKNAKIAGLNLPSRPPFTSLKLELFATTTDGHRSTQIRTAPTVAFHHEYLLTVQWPKAKAKPQLNLTIRICVHLCLSVVLFRMDTAEARC